MLGYERLPYEPARLSKFFEKLTAISLPLTPYINNYAGVDGTLFQLAVFGDLYSSWRFHWWEDAPPQWYLLVEIANEMVAAFDIVAGKSAQTEI